MPRVDPSLPWALRSLVRSPRVRLATSFALVVHLLSTVLLARLQGVREIPAFAYLYGFIPIALLAAVTQGNLFGVDRGSTLAAMATPMRATTFARARLMTSLAWTLGVLLPGWLLGAALLGRAALPVTLLQLAFAFLHCAIAGTLAVYAPSSRSYSRMGGQTMSFAALFGLNTVGLLTIAGALRLLTANGAARTSAVAGVCAVTAVVLAILGVVGVGHAFEARRDHVMDAVKENP